MVKKKIINTTNREIYDKLNKLKYTPFVLLENVEFKYINKIINTINSENKIIDLKILDDKFLLQKINSVNYDIYLKNKIS